MRSGSGSTRARGVETIQIVFGIRLMGVKKKKNKAGWYMINLPVVIVCRRDLRSYSFKRSDKETDAKI